MRTLAICGLTALTLLGGAVSAQDSNPSGQAGGAMAASDRSAEKPFVVPAEHQEFVAEFKSLLQKYPKAAERFRLAQLVEAPALPKSRPVIWKCEDFGEFGSDCRPVPIE
jgi:hypothetical protein